MLYIVHSYLPFRLISKDCPLFSQQFRHLQIPPQKSKLEEIAIKEVHNFDLVEKLGVAWG